ncbi:MULTISPECIES: YncE family protein [unclassified Pseudomonas]|uniref:YncE family protein n=1 Tax=unclassified Pseudomonas TaxID=196821 RepID=UPI000BCCBB17|nr:MULTISPECIES: YncE family protein [unclassified Pseudomonas]PVZ20536.1 YVTN family beta-propeller protein [Pseudomonas sp. URIL14HWK12:I12]PVZ27602.1 YVTN family beta-propeller protein [Pseudomonas sp. URIL14HWK12:I10]PVZ38491.1 YVTN family beta-propeller protein [Pseudomonas sp. URIL14HWK12:I11]SNZ03145.1 40-residue YVTN family beta-propeller repeat-containing protein [Pseudomonas sp. URIL14HWK12:I9]
MGCSAWAGQAPYSSQAPDIPISHQDRVYAAEQFSNTVSVTDPADNRVLGVIALGDPQPMNLSPLYKGEVLVHGMGFSPDHKTLAVVSIGTNSVSFIDTETNTVKHKTYVGRSPHEAFYTPDGREVWVTVRGENYVAVLDAATYAEKRRIITPAGPGMQIFSPDGQYGYICSSFNPETVIVSTSTHEQVGKVTQASPFCPNIAASPDGQQVWFTLKDTGKAQVFNARPPFQLLKTVEIGPIANHVNFARTAKGQFAYVTVGGLNQVQVYDTKSFDKVATVDVGKLPHGVWPSGDGTRIYVGLENDDALAVIDTTSNTLIATIPIGQAPQAIAYVAHAVEKGPGTENLKPLGEAAQAAHIRLKSTRTHELVTSVTLFSQGLTQVLQAAATGLEPGKPYTLALAEHSDGTGTVQPLAAFMANPAGAAIVNAVGPIRQIVQADQPATRRYLAIIPGAPGSQNAPVQTQAD